MATFNAKWGGYAFPMIAVPEGGDIVGSLAIEAAEHDLGCRLPNATAAEFDFMGLYGVSQRTGEETPYEYWLYAVDPNQALDLLAVGTIGSDLGYRGPAVATLIGEISDVHFSNRFHRDRHYRLQDCDVQLSDIDLHQPKSVLEQALARRGKKFRWVPGSKLNDPAIAFSQTMAAVRTTVLSVIRRGHFPARSGAPKAASPSSNARSLESGNG